MKACSGANYWYRQFKALGHEVKLISPQFVKPFVKTNKNDANDAQAICEAASRPTMHFFCVKSIEKQDIQSIHRVRKRLSSNRTGLANQIRGLLTEYGIVVAKGLWQLRQQLPAFWSRMKVKQGFHLLGMDISTCWGVIHLPCQTK